MNVFISYRRNDTKHAAARIAEWLDETSDIDDVFIDVTDISLGALFKERIEQALEDTDVCLVIIGNSWTGSDDDLSQARILVDGDFVRHEVAMALASGKRVIPVLVDGAKMPDKETLPLDVRPVTSLNAASLRHASFDRDIGVIDDAIHLRKKPSSINRILQRHPFVTLALKVFAGILATVISIIVVGIVHYLITGRSINQTLNSSGMVVWVITGVVFSLGIAFSIWSALRRRS